MGAFTCNVPHPDSEECAKIEPLGGPRPPQNPNRGCPEGCWRAVQWSIHLMVRMAESTQTNSRVTRVSPLTAATLLLLVTMVVGTTPVVMGLGGRSQASLPADERTESNRLVQTRTTQVLVLRRLRAQDDAEHKPSAWTRPVVGTPGELKQMTDDRGWVVPAAVVLRACVGVERLNLPPPAQG